MADVSVRKAGPADRPILERLWLMFWHDMSEFRDQLPDPDGTFHSERLQAAMEDTHWTSYLLAYGDRPVGLALVHDLGGQKRILNSFFVVRGARRAGIGLRAVQDVVTRYPGHWEIAFQDENAAAVRFWRHVATKIAGDAWTEDRRPVPGQPSLPPDTWISFDVPA